MYWLLPSFVLAWLEFCCVLVPGMLAFHLQTSFLQLQSFRFHCITVCDHIWLISLKPRSRAVTGRIDVVDLNERYNVETAKLTRALRVQN